MKIYSNWGDKYLVGLNGIELFDSNGCIVDIEKVRIFYISKLDLGSFPSNRFFVCL